MGLLFQHRRLKAQKMKRAINKTRSALQHLRLFLALIMTLAICYFGLKVLKLPQWYIDPIKLNAADKSVMTIQGNSITPDYKIINMVRQTQLPYTQVFRLDTKDLEQNISQLQPIRKVYIRRFWFPARLSIIVDERIPAFLVAPNLESEPVSALTADGVVIDHDYLPLNPNLKAKKLLTYGVKDGHDEVWDKKKVEEILKLVKAVETYSGQEVQYIDIRNRSNIYIMIKDYLIRFGEINDTAQKRVKKIASILPQAKIVEKERNQKLKYIDLRWDDAQYFRMEGEKETEKPTQAVQASVQKQGRNIDEQAQEPQDLNDNNIREQDTPQDQSQPENPFD